MRNLASIIAALALAGCTSAAVKADDEYRFLKENGGSKNELCAAAKKARDAWALEKNQDRYGQAKLNADIACLSARMEAAGL
jgi:hypothetical protein